MSDPNFKRITVPISTDIDNIRDRLERDTGVKMTYVQIFNFLIHFYDMTPAKMFDGDLWMLASDGVKMAENAYKKGQTDEREACAKLCEEVERQATRQPPMVGQGCQACAAAIRARGQE